MGYARKDIEKTKKIAKKFVRYQKEGRALQHLLFYTIIIKVAWISFSIARLSLIESQQISLMSVRGYGESESPSRDLPGGMP